MGKKISTTTPSAAKISAELHAPALKTDAKLLAREAGKLAAAFDDIRPEYKLAQLAFYATAAPEDDGLGLDVRKLAQAVTVARFRRANPGADAQSVKDGTASGSVYFVGKSRIADYAASFRFLVTHSLVNSEAFAWAQKCRNRKIELPALVSGMPDVSGEARTDAFIGLCREALSVSHAAARVAREARVAERDAEPAPVAGDPSEGDSGPVPMSAEVAVAVLAEVAATAWGKGDREVILAALSAALDALTAPALA
jgi:hypothetical protein